MDTIFRIDTQVFQWINGLAGRSMVADKIMRLLVNDYFVPVCMAFALACLWFLGSNAKQRDLFQRAVFWGATSIGITNLVIKIMNLNYFRERPFTEFPTACLQAGSIFYMPTDSSFPSNGTAVAFTVAMSIFLVHRYLGGASLLLATLFGFSRVYAGVHYPLDVVGGAAIGIIIAIIIKLLYRFIEPIPTLLLRVFRKICLA